MTNEAQKHLVKAGKLIAKGDGFYREAGAEIALAREAGATWTVIGDALGRSSSWCKTVAEWSKTPANDGPTSFTPYSGTGRPHQDKVATRKVLREAPVDEVEKLLDELPAERKAEIRLHLNVTKPEAEKTGRTISEITGSGPVYEATQLLAKARKYIVAVPARLAVSGVLGNEANFPQFQRELERLKNAIVYLDRYIADETVIDGDALDNALAKILAGEEV